MRGLLVLSLLLLAPLATAQNPVPADQLVTHPLTVQEKLEEIRDINPDFIRMESFGKSELDFDLWLLDYVHPDKREPNYVLNDMEVFYLDANHHGNEQLGMEALLIFMEELAQWSLTPEGQQRLSEVRVVAAPMINPDGTGRNNRVNTNFVDLNRNYDYNWGLYGTSDTASPTGGTYRGSSPLSEVESRANARLMEELEPRVYLSMHTGSHDIVLPWRNSTGGDGPMPDWPVYAEYLAGIKNVSGLDYRDPSGAGESISHAYGNIGAISLIVEVDELQSQVVVSDIPERLKEEVAIYWYTLEVLEKIGGHLVVVEGRLCNDGWGPSYNITRSYNHHDHQVTVIADELQPGACMDVDPHPEYRSDFTAYRTIQHALAYPEPSRFAPGAVSIPAANGTAGEGPDEADAAGVAVLVPVAVLVAVAFALRRRAA